MAKLWTLKDKKILIVDDFPAMRSMMRSMLVAYSANNIKEARNGDEALAHLKKETIEIVMCDYNLGDNSKDGQQILEEAKQRELLPYSSIFIMTTAENTNTMVMGAVEHMPDNYLVKPYTKVILQSRLRKLMDKKEGLKSISKAISKKKYQSAIGMCDVAMSKDPKLVFDMMKLKGDLFLKLSDYPAAQELYKEVLDIREVVWAQFGLGKSHFFQENLEDARGYFEAVIKQNKTFVSAYDWLARVETAMGKKDSAQQTLQKAVEISPKGLLRQRALAEVSMENEDYDISEKAYKTVVKEGRNSIHKSPADYGGLAQVHIKKNSNDAALKAIVGMKKEYRNADSQAKLISAVVESVVSKDLGREEASAEALGRAMDLFQEDPGALSSDDAVKLADACFALGEKDKASELVKHVIRNHHEDEDILDNARKMFVDAGMGAEAEELINGTCQEVVSINNDGVGLAKEGKLAESISLFARAARAMPENLVINLNAAQSLIMLMQKDGTENEKLQHTQAYLDKVKSINAQNERYTSLLNRFYDLTK